jgi:hypothetical protein
MMGCTNSPVRGGGNPKSGQFVLAGSQVLENAGHESPLQGKAKLDAQKAEAHVPDLPKGKAFLCHGNAVLNGNKKDYSSKRGALALTS